eukprot:5863788-Karenia_brevis.AAC.1
MMWAVEADGPKLLMKSRLTKRNGWYRIGNRIFDKGFALRVLTASVYPGAKASQRTLWNDLVASFIRAGNPAALMFPRDREKLIDLQDKACSIFSMGERMNEYLCAQGEFECVSVDSSYKVCMSIVGQ